MKEIYKGLIQCFHEEVRAVIATIVNVDGSSYRREGARCLIYETGKIEGMLSGGCVETDILEYTREVLNSKCPKLIEYDFRWENDSLWGLGVGCNGVIKVWLEPFDPVNDKENARILLAEIQNQLNCDAPYLFLSVLESADHSKLQPGLHITEDSGKFVDEFPKILEKPSLIETVVNGVEATIFAELVQPLSRLFIIGSGLDAAFLAKRANELEWRVTVIDHRESYLLSHFSNINTVLIKRGDYESVPIPPESYVVIMTHNLELDQLALTHLLNSHLHYIGLLGSRERYTKLIDILYEGKNDFYNSYHKIHSPVGLDIGAESPEEITLSILAELIAYKNNRAGGPLCCSKIVN